MNKSTEDNVQKLKIYPNVDSNPNFADISNEVLKFWQDKDIFTQSVKNRPKENSFIFFDGPPFANGLPHHGHLLTGFIKDIVARYQTLKGKRVERKFGWDCHGLPVEMEIEKQLGISGRVKILEYGIDKFNEHCRKSVQKYTKEWEDYITKQARWVDFENAYKTMDLSYMESVLWVFKKLYDQGLVYESKRVMPYSWACETPLSNFETRMDNSYKKVTDKAITVKFELKNKPKGAPDGFKSYRLLAWTTTPWTLPSNLALVVGENIKYACVGVGDECLILALSSVAKYKKELMISDENSSIDYVTVTGKSLEGIQYSPLFNYFIDHPNSFKVLIGGFVEEGEGTSIVHCAPGFGEDDQILSAEHGIDLVCPVDEKGRFTKEVSDFEGMQVFDANDKIIIRLKENNNWLKTEQCIHNYPHCWRTDTPLIYKAMPSWYVKVTKIKDLLIKNNKKINWIPEHIKEGLFGKWLDNVKDWSISRNRFWGTPIPIWISDDSNYPRIDVYGSIEEMEKDFGVKIKDLHRPYIDDLTRPNPDDPTRKSKMKRVPDVFDCWFDSGSMPYAQKHYPFENKESLDQNHSADFIVEYTAQTRGWFYTLTVLSAALFDQPAFLNCICHGVILDENGQKLSKRLKNYIDPEEVFKKYGSDALRFFMSSSSVMRGQELHIDKEGKMISDTVRLVLKPIWNSYNFFTLYANSDGISAKEITDSENFNDKYILSKLKVAVENIDSALQSYNLPSACNEIKDLFEVLNNWYIRRNRPRFWSSVKSKDKQSAYDTLYTVLKNICIAGSPLLPLLFEKIYSGLVCSGNFDSNQSVHLCDYPDASKFKYYPKLVDDIDKVRSICTAGLNIRNTTNIRTRQPLSKLTIIGSGFDGLDKYFDLIKDEVNVKNVLVSTEVEKYAKYNLKMNFKLLSARLSHKMKDLIAASKKGDWKLTGNNILIAGEKLYDEEFSLTLNPLQDDTPSSVIDRGLALAMLDTNITQVLEYEGIARDIVRMIQQMRKDADLHVSEKISLSIDTSEKLIKAIDLYKNYIKDQTLSKDIFYNADHSNAIASEDTEISDVKIKLHIL